jgi:hypothetical protein
MFELSEVAIIGVALDGATQSRVSHVQYTSDEPWLFRNPIERPMIPFSGEDAYPVDDNVAFVRRLFHEIFCPSHHAIKHLEMSVESLCIDFALFVSDNTTEVICIKKRQLLEMVQRGEDQKIVSA